MSLVALPRAEAGLGHPIELLLARRRTVRAFAARPVSLLQASCLLWAAQGVSDRRGLRTAPSAGGLYPLELYLVAGAVSGLEPGMFRYHPRENALEAIQGGDQRNAVAAAALDQSWIADAALTLVFTARYARTVGKYGKRGIQYVHMEAGHAAQNALLSAVALGLGAAVVGAFDDRRMATLLRLSGDESPLYLVPAGQAAVG